MVSAIAVVAVAAAGYAVFSLASSWRANVLAARKTGLPYIVTPCAQHNLIWQLTYRFWVVLIRLLPKHMWEGWLFILMPDWGYKIGQTAYAQLGDTFVVASPRALEVVTQSPDAIHQITSRREHFPKATMHYTILELFGRNIVTTEGATWRMHRKATSSSFNEKNAAHAFSEAIHQTQGMVAEWAAKARSRTPTITTVTKDTMMLALHIIGYVGFGLRFTWPGQAPTTDMDARMLKYSSHTPPAGHTMTFAASVEKVLHHIVLMLVMPVWLLRVLGRFMAVPREAYEANRNYARYMREFIEDKVESARAGGRGDGGMDLMGQLVRARYEQEKAVGKVDGEGDKGSSGGSGGSSSNNTLTDDEIIGNAFIMLVAGHETTANSLHFAIIELATNPASQRALQADIDRLLGRDSKPAAWNYEASINMMLASMLGAVINETLRLFPPVVVIPKWVSPQADQPLALAETGRTHVLPARMGIILMPVTAHRHPKYWPTARGTSSDDNNDLDEFCPERWFRTDADTGSDGDATKDTDVVDGADTEDYGGFKGPDTSAQLFRPVRGSFVPFSDGPRSCLGRRIAQVEMLAALAVIFQRYSIELAVDAWADDAAVAAMDTTARRTLYAQAQARSREMLRSAKTVLTLKLPGEAYVPVRMVPRGEELFVHCVDM